MYIIQLKNHHGLSPWNRWNVHTELKFDKKIHKYDEDQDCEFEYAEYQECNLENDGLDHTELKEIL